MTDRPKWLIEEPAEVYHGKASQFLSSHQLADFRRCPQLYWKKHSGLIEDRDTPAYAFGRATHTLVLEGRDVFEEQFAIGGPINPSTGKPFGSNTKTFAAWVAKEGKPVVTDEEAIMLEMIEQAVLTHPVTPRLITGGFAEGVCRANYGGMPCQIRMDYFHPDEGFIDLKTCDDLTWFESDARKYGYLHQVAFYRAVLRAVTDKSYPVYFIAVEKKQPLRVGVWKVSELALDFAEVENQEAIRRLKQCIETQEFPTGYEQIRIYDTV